MQNARAFGRPRSCDCAALRKLDTTDVGGANLCDLTPTEEKKTKKSKVGSKKRKAEAAARPESEEKLKKEPGVAADGTPKQGAVMGSLIGRKRRAKAGKR
ncbi:hypothetical protein JCM11491_006588 [Sporobolomyces phaffii]